MIHWRLTQHSKTFLKSFYKTEYVINADVQTEFLDLLHIPKLSEEFKNNLDEQLSIAKISEATNMLNAGKTAVPEGLPIDQHKQLKNKIVPPLYNMYLESYSNGYLHTSMRGFDHFASKTR